ncbi:m7GpppX diphosphatase [Phlebotomus argentipes]|uniref:m7GpppX diphosphatase n=1 Tax=Phlebotomus argentipes TaxID=94469 RepID=UPI0028932AA0|nr:m7GpppX diphosphatase [Phlebotomus argentipes]
MSGNEATEKDAVQYDFSQFQLDRILNSNSGSKTVSLLGRFKNLSQEKRAIVILEKKAFTEADLTSKTGFFSDSTTLRKEFVNDIYGNFECFPRPDINSVKTTVIYPATEKHIEKYSKQEIHIVQETPELYRELTLKHLEKEQFSLEWLYNILEHKKEKDRIVFEDACEETGFILLPDLKWDNKTAETLYCLALVRKRGIKSLRDLNASHLPLLRNILTKGVAAIEEKYGVARSQLRIYLHYQPSFYHLHVHFTYLKHDAPGIFCEKSHLLDSVISNIELMPDYYQRATLSFVVRQNDRLWDDFRRDSDCRKSLKRD